MHRTKIMGFLLGVSATLVVAQPEYDLPRLEALAMASSRSVLAAREQITAARYAVDRAVHRARAGRVAILEMPAASF